MTQPAGETVLDGFELADQWPVGLEGALEGCMVAAGNGRVLVALKLEDEYEDGCFLFDLADRSCTREHWFQPAWVRQQWEVLQMGPEKGIRGLSAMNYGDRVLAAVATRAGFAACWELGSDQGCTIETENSVQTVALHPHADLLAIGTGRRVLDLESQAIAEVQIWSTDGEEMVDRRRLPGACVMNLLWVHHDDELVSGYRLRMVDGLPLGLDQRCVVMESGSLNTLLVVTTETRNQRGGFVTLLDPQLLTILDIAEIPEGNHLLSPICAWPEQREIWAGCMRNIEDLHDTYLPDADLLAAPQRTPSGHLSGISLEDGRRFRFRRDESDAWAAQVWRPLP